MAEQYNVGDIKVLEGLDAVRMRPGMYIGSTGVRGLHHILWEIVDNAVDEAANGFADRVDVILYPDGSVSVEDNGRGIPTAIHPVLKVSGVEVVFTKLHAGGKFDEKSYNYSGGLHGVGASVTNALSEWLTVEVYNKTVYKMRFHSVEKDGKISSGAPDGHLVDTGEKTKKSGTLVHFLADKRVFETTVYNFETVAKRLRELAFLNKGTTFTLSDRRVEDNPIEKQYKYDGGISDYVTYLNDGKNPLYTPPIHCTMQKENIYVEFAIQHTDAYTESTYSYVNNIPTPEGGMHETGFKSGLTKSLNDYARTSGTLKDKDENFVGEDFREGMTALLLIKMHNVQFEGQTKTKLGNPEARLMVEAATIEFFDKFTKDNKNKKLLTSIMDKALQAAKVRFAEKRAKDAERKKNSIDNSVLIGKLASCTGKKAELNELFIVEGNSAGGTAKEARDRKFQSILPLRGKPLNAEKKRIDQVLANEEIRTIIGALGTGIGRDFTLGDLKYDKVVILSDADQDGAHIRSILLTFFFRYMRELVTEGHVYIGMPPLYKVYKKDVIEYAYDDKELEAKKKLVGLNAEIQRYKGLGEMNGEQLWETTMNPETRLMTQVTLEDAAEAEKLITILMGDGVEARKSYIFEYADFNKEDTFMKQKNFEEGDK